MDPTDSARRASGGAPVVPFDESYFRAILRTSPDCAFVFDERLRVLALNEIAEQTFQRTSAESLGLDLADLFVTRPDGAANWDTSGRRVRVRARRASGDEFPAELSLAVVPDVEPRVSIGYVREVTAQLRLERESSEARSRVEVLAAASELLASSTDHERTLRNVIEAAIPVLGDFGFFDVVEDDGEVRRIAKADDPRRQAILDKTRWRRTDRQDYNLCALSTGKTGVHPFIDDEWLRGAASGPKHLEVMRSLGFCSMITVPLRTRDRLLGALTLLFADSRRRYTAADVALAEELARRAAAAVDHARVHRRLLDSEERHNLALGAGRLGSWEWDVAKNLVRWSPSLEEIHGIPAGSFSGTLEAYESDIHPEDKERVTAEVASVLETRRPHHMIYRIVRPDGEVRWLEAHGRVFADESGRVVRLIGVCADVTDRRVAEQRLQQAHERLILQERRKDEFLAMLGHELRNPLSPIMTGAYLLRNGSPATVARVREVLDRQVRHLARLVDDLLDVSRIARGKIELKTEPLDLRKLLEEVVEDGRAAAEAAGVTVTLETGTEPCWIDADSTRIAQVFGNLAGNAVKFTPAKGRVSIRLRADAGFAEVAVEDTGIGIAPALLPELFEPFMQADRSLERSGGGLGLGLAVVRGIVSLHGGTASAASEGTGHGATFRVRLPLAPPGNVRSAALLEKFTDSQRRKVLIVEDNTDAATLLKDVLESRGHMVTIARTGEEGIRVARTSLPDVVVCDLGLPGTDGYAVARALREDPRDLILLAVSGYATGEDRRRSAEAGFDAHFAKPVPLEELLRRL